MTQEVQHVAEFKNAYKASNIASFRKENSFYKSIVLVDTARKDVVLDIRFYGKSATYCCAWLSRGYGPQNESARAGAKASGYGYHKESAAMESALRLMGIAFAVPFAGVGDAAMRDALEALARFLGVADFMIVTAHG